MAKVLITGAAGFIGMHTSIRFIEAGWDVIGLDNMNNYYSVELKNQRLQNIINISKNSDATFIFFELDLNSNDWGMLNKHSFDLVIHLAAQAGVRYSLENPMAYIQSNILGFQKVLEFVNKNDITRLIYASSSSVYGKDSTVPFIESDYCNSPESYYAATKKCNELMAKVYNKTHKVSSIGLRLFTVYGPWGRPDMAPMIFTKAGFDNTPIKVFNHGNQKRDFTYIDDIVDGIFQLSQLKDFPKAAEVFNLGNSNPVNLMDFISTIEKELSVNFEKQFVREQKGDVQLTYSNNSKINNYIDYYPSVKIEEGLRKTINWYREYYGK